jgi:hypothetical protein
LNLYEKINWGWKKRMGLDRVFKKLTPGGKIFFETLKTWNDFIEKKEKIGLEWFF